MFEHFSNFFLRGGPTRTAPLDPACIWIEDSSRNRFALNGIQRIACFSAFLHQTNFFLQKCSNIFKQNIFSPILFFSKVFKFTWKMRNRLKRKKNQISDFYFSSYGHFSDVIPPIFNEFFTITQKIKIGEFFYHFFHSIQHTSHHP